MDANAALQLPATPTLAPAYAGEAILLRLLPATCCIKRLNDSKWPVL